MEYHDSRKITLIMPIVDILFQDLDMVDANVMVCGFGMVYQLIADSLLFLVLGLWLQLQSKIQFLKTFFQEDINLGLLVFRAVAGPRNLARSVKSRDNDKKVQNHAKFLKICT